MFYSLVEVSIHKVVLLLLFIMASQASFSTSSILTMGSSSSSLSQSQDSTPNLSCMNTFPALSSSSSGHSSLLNSNASESSIMNVPDSDSSGHVIIDLSCLPGHVPLMPALQTVVTPTHNSKGKTKERSCSYRDKPLSRHVHNELKNVEDGLENVDDEKENKSKDKSESDDTRNMFSFDAFQKKRSDAIDNGAGSFNDYRRMNEERKEAHEEEEMEMSEEDEKYDDKGNDNENERLERERKENEKGENERLEEERKEKEKKKTENERKGNEELENERKEKENQKKEKAKKDKKSKEKKKNGKSKPSRKERKRLRIEDENYQLTYLQWMRDSAERRKLMNDIRSGSNQMSSSSMFSTASNNVYASMGVSMNSSNVSSSSGNLMNISARNDPLMATSMLSTDVNANTLFLSGSNTVALPTSTISHIITSQSSQSFTNTNHSSHSPSQQSSSSSNQNSSHTTSSSLNNSHAVYNGDPSDPGSDPSGSGDSDSSDSSFDVDDKESEEEVQEEENHDVRKKKRRRDGKLLKLQQQIGVLQERTREVKRKSKESNQPVMQMMNVITELLKNNMNSFASKRKSIGKDDKDKDNNYEKRIKLINCTKLTYEGVKDYDEWFITFEDVVRTHCIAKKDWYKALLTRLKDSDEILQTTPEEVKGDYEKFRDWFLNRFGPVAPLWDCQQQLHALEKEALSMLELMKRIKKIRNKYRRAAVRKKKENVNLDNVNIYSVLLHFIPRGSPEYSWILDLRKNDVDYTTMEPDIEQRLALFDRTSDSLIPLPFHLRTQDDLLSNSSNFANCIRNSVNTIDSVNAMGPMQKNRMTESGLMNAPLNQNRNNGDRSNIECFYCGMKGHYRNECFVKQFHESKGMMLVSKDKTKDTLRKFNSVNKLHNRFHGKRKNQTRSVNVFSRQNFSMRKRPVGRLRFVRGKFSRNDSRSNGYNLRDNRKVFRRFSRQPFRSFAISELGAWNEEENDNNKGDRSKSDSEDSESGELSDDSMGEWDLNEAFVDESGQTFGVDEVKDFVLNPEVPASMASTYFTETIPLSQLSCASKSSSLNQQ